MTTIELIDDEIQTKKLEKIIIQIALDGMMGKTPEEVIDNHIWQLKELINE